VIRRAEQQIESDLGVCVRRDLSPINVAFNEQSVLVPDRLDEAISPYVSESWVTFAVGRAEHEGSAIDCPLCDRTEMPEGLAQIGTSHVWDEVNRPGFRRGFSVWLYAAGLAARSRR
jgi:hypothetical protein